MTKKIFLYQKCTLVICFTWVLLYFIACGMNPQTTAERKLAKQNINISPKSLFKTIELGDVQNTFLLLEAGIDINVIINKKTPLIAAIDLDKQKVIEHLITQWVPDVTMKQDNGRTALIAAIEKSNTNIIRKLINLGADIDDPLNDGTTPLMKATLVGNYELVNILLKSGANPNLKNSNNDSALSIAIANNEKKILRLLQKTKI